MGVQYKKQIIFRLEVTREREKRDGTWKMLCLVCVCVCVYLVTLGIPGHITHCVDAYAEYCQCLGLQTLYIVHVRVDESICAHTYQLIFVQALWSVYECVHM